MTDNKFIEDDLDRMIYHRILDSGVFLGGLMCPSSILATIRHRKRTKLQPKVEVQIKMKEKPKEIPIYPL